MKYLIIALLLCSFVAQAEEHFLIGVKNKEGWHIASFWVKHLDRSGVKFTEVEKLKVDVKVDATTKDKKALEFEKALNPYLTNGVDFKSIPAFANLLLPIDEYKNAITTDVQATLKKWGVK